MIINKKKSFSFIENYTEVLYLGDVQKQFEMWAPLRGWKLKLKVKYAFIQ